MSTRKGAWVIVGAGVMGRALREGLEAAKVVDKKNLFVSVRNAERRSELEGRSVQTISRDHPKRAREVLASAEMVLLCVKPFQIQETLNDLKAMGLSSKSTLVSVLTGVSIKKIKTALKSRGLKNGVVRAMPNTPCLVRQGMTVFTADESVSDAVREKVRTLFSAVGAVLELEEKYFDAVTALGGSGPAYFLLIIEALVNGGVAVGLPREHSRTIVTETLLGTTALLLQSDKHAAALRDDVTTPGGCTAAALLVMEDGKIRSTLAHAIREATRIAALLGQS